MFEFKIKQKSKISSARIALFSTPHGDVETPVFMPVGTVGAVKTMSPQDLKDVGSQIILANTYHMYLRPSEKVVKAAGGLHSFMRYDGPILTDSGGFQVFSLSLKKSFERGAINIKPAKISEDGVTFYSHIDGSKHFLTPEKSIQIQEDLGADIIMAFDDCAPAGISENSLRKSVDRTHRWLERCIKVKKRNDQALFPICQGGVDLKLREESARFIGQFDTPGYAIGGVSVGEAKEKIYEVSKFCASILDENKPRYLMGIGYPEDIVEIVRHGIDMFDCVLPTRLARHGVVWVRDYSANAKKFAGLDYGYRQVDLTKSEQKNNLEVIDDMCDCYSCKNRFSRTYISHLIKEKEPLGIHLSTMHNLRFTISLVEDIKAAIKSSKY